MNGSKPSRTSRIPALRHHKASGRAVVTLSGRDHYCGKWGDPEAVATYSRLVNEWVSHGRCVAPAATPEHAGPSCNEVAVAYLEHVGDYFRTRDGQPNRKELSLVAHTIKPMRELYGTTPAADFTPKRLKAVREKYIALGWSRTGVNRATARLRSIFGWAVENELVPGSVWHGLQAVKGLRMGHTEAPETTPIGPVPDGLIAMTLPYLSPTVAAMVRLARATGMRPTEVCLIRTCDVDVTGKVWRYVPQFHKTEHAGLTRTVYVGPRGQSILRPLLRTELEHYVFDPAEAVAEWLRTRHEQRRTPTGQGNGPGTHRRRSPKRRPTERYDVNGFRHAIWRACDRADRAAREAAGQPGCEACDGRTRIKVDGHSRPCPKCDGAGRIGARLVARWSPNALRHSFATAARKACGLDVASVLLGHVDAETTAIYAERDTEAAEAAVLKIG